MQFIAFLKSVLSFASLLTEYLRNKDLIKAGEAKAISDGFKKADETVQKARRDREIAVLDFDRSNRGVCENDRNLRD